MNINIMQSYLFPRVIFCLVKLPLELGLQNGFINKTVARNIQITSSQNQCKAFRYGYGNKWYVN